MKDKRYYITLGISSLLALLLIIAIWSYSDNSRVAFSCSINNIEYRDVTPNECWDDGINATYCPLPHDIGCSGDVAGLGSLLMNIMLNSFD